jgi:TolB-like protein/DNA-binding winged helix-turn-helix (wHTH) protein
MAEQFRKRYRLGEFEIEPEKRLLKRKNKTVHLAHKPFIVLLYLIENRERLVKRDELLERFWDGCDVYDVNLSKCVGAIRKALGERHDSSRFIETRWAEGYRYIGPLEEEVIEELLPSVGIQKTLVDDTVHDKDTSEIETGLYQDDALSASADVKITSRPVLISICIAILLFVVGGAALLFYRYPSVPESSKTPVRSIAVLPLKNLSGDQSNEYFSDGLTDSLITALSKVDELKVISRGSVFRYKGKDVDPREVGNRLNVAAVLEGSVRRSGDSIQVTVRLVSAEDGSVLWAGETYERSIGDILTLQDEIARNIVAGLRVQLTGSSEQRLAKRYTNNVEAYQLYLKGRYFWNKRTVESLKKSVEHFEQAIAKDPDYALAYTGLADCYQLLAEYHLATPPKEGFAKARTSAIRALEIDSNLAEAHTSLAYTLAFYDWDFVNAEKEFRRALELDPNYATAHLWYSEYLVAMGRFDEALVENKRALQLDPTSLVANIDLVSFHYVTRQFDQSIAHSQKVLEMEPDSAYVYVYLSFSYGKKGMKREAAEAYIKSVELFGEEREAEELRRILEKNGVKAMWQHRLEQVNAPVKRDAFSAQWRALFYLRIGDKEKALDWLEKAYERRDRWVINMKYSPELDDLHAEPRFQELLRRINL